jgi:hypothetical protein
VLANVDVGVVVHVDVVGFFIVKQNKFTLGSHKPEGTGSKKAERGPTAGVSSAFRPMHLIS